MEQENFDDDFEVGELTGLYADSFCIGHDTYKFVVGFGQCDSEAESSRFHTKVIMGPDSAKCFFEALGKSVKEYEDKFGTVNFEKQ